LRDGASAVIDLYFRSGAGWSACTARGSARAHNSDALAVDVSGKLLAFAVADGVGSMEASPLASAVAVAAVASWVKGRNTVDERDIPSLFAAIDGAVRQALSTRSGEGATTIACAIVSARRVVIATVGDSEVLSVGTDGPAERLNELDHLKSRPNTLLAWIDGKTELEPHVIRLNALPHRLCLVTDGVVQALDYYHIARIVREWDPSVAAREMVLSARRRGASDDVTVLVLGGDIVNSDLSG